MNPRGLKWIVAPIAIALGIGGWIATLWAASDRWAGVAFTTIVVLMIAAAYRGRFAANEQARDFWTGFALFGLVHLLVANSDPTNNLMTCALVDRVGDHYLGIVKFMENPTTYLTPLGDSLARIPIERGGGQLWNYLSYIRQTTKLFAILLFAGFGGLVGCHLRRRSVRIAPEPKLGDCPLLGIIWLILLALLIGGAFLIHTNPVTIPASFFHECPGSEAANFALYNIEFLAVLFAALEARYAIESHRPWWIGFALFGGVHLVTNFNGNGLGSSLPTQWMDDLMPWLYFQYVSDRPMPEYDLRSSTMDKEILIFWRTTIPWIALAKFLALAWMGTVAARVVRRIGDKLTRPGWLRSAIARLMLWLAVIGILLAMVRSDGSASVLSNALVLLFLFATIRACFGPRSSRAWWWGFALVGGVDLLIGADVDHQVFSPEHVLPTWPIHGLVARLHRQDFVARAGQAVPYLPAFDSVDDPQVAIYHAFHRSRALVLFSLSLPMALVGAYLALWLDRGTETRLRRVHHSEAG